MSAAPGKRQVSLSFDIDWAPDEVILDTIEILERTKAKATFFATHATDVLARLDRSRYEIGIHPNFCPHLDGKGKGNLHDVLREAIAMYPDIVGMRSHGVVSSGPILYHAREMGIVYESNMYVPAQVMPFRDYEGMIRIPMYWSDYRELLVKTPYRADAFTLLAGSPAVLAFHPAHVFINSETPARYNETRNLSTEEKRAKRHVGSPKGIRDFLVELLARIEREGIETVTMREIAEAHAQTHGDAIAIHPHDDTP